VSDVEAKRWLKGSPVDLTLYTVVQPHFVSSPVIALGAVDPVVGTRSALISGQVDVVTVPDLSEPARREAPRRSFVSFVSSYPGGVRRFARANGFGGKRSPRQELIERVREVASAPHGQGRDALTRSALRLYSLCKRGRLDRDEVTGALKWAMLEQGWEPDEEQRGRTLADVNRQLVWCWEHAD
jgi:hypothetical protein